MEDASKEFQIFLSPTRDFQQPYRDSAQTKHRIVPVINKILSSSSSTFTLNQRKSSVYKAVSGVSFQDTDVAGKKPVSRKEKREKKKERRQSYAAPIADLEKKQSVPVVPGARRSRSLTSMESSMSASTDLSKNPPEITHPFAPVVMYHHSSGRSSRYSKGKERRRSSSQARNGLESKKHDSTGALQKNEQQPVRPRRARSASRSRKPLALASFSSENNLDIPTLARDDLFHLRCERQAHKQSRKDRESTPDSNTYQEIEPLMNKHRTSESSGDIDFSVNDSDWRRYDILVTEKLDTLLKKKKEEPEGGYFSLEREEPDELERFSENGDHFQRDNCSETIYVAQVFADDPKESPLPKYEQYTVEEIYSEVPFSNQGQEVGFVDDEGLYEEIFFDRGNEEPSDTSFNNQNYGKTSPVNILVSPNLESTQNASKTLVEIEGPKIEKSASTTIVYIGGDNVKHKNSTFYAPLPSSHLLKQSSSCNNLTFNYNLKNTSKEKNSSIGDFHKDSSEEKHQKNNPAWCGCLNRPNLTASHTSSCIQSRSGLMSPKYTLIGDNNDEKQSNRVQSVNEASSSSRKPDEPASSSSSDNSSPSQGSKVPEPDYELSDIDLDMFAPKPLNYRTQRNASETNIRSVPNAHPILPPRKIFNLPQLNHLNENLFRKSESKEITSPKTFRGFLEDSIFNPPDTESLVGDPEGLVIQDDQIVTCITDSSSDDDSSDDEDDLDNTTVTSPWLEAKNEFEFVAFKEEKSKLSKLGRRKKPRKAISIPKIFSSPLLSLSASSSDTQLNNTHLKNSLSDSKKDVPKRPTRRRRTCDAIQLEGTN